MSFPSNLSHRHNTVEALIHLRRWNFPKLQINTNHLLNFENYYLKSVLQPEMESNLDVVLSAVKVALVKSYMYVYRNNSILNCCNLLCTDAAVFWNLRQQYPDWSQMFLPRMKYTIKFSLIASICCGFFGFLRAFGTLVIRYFIPCPKVSQWV